MVKLTTELIMNSYQFINPVKDRELDLRGKLPYTMCSIHLSNQQILILIKHNVLNNMFYL